MSSAVLSSSSNSPSCFVGTGFPDPNIETYPCLTLSQLSGSSQGNGHFNKKGALVGSKNKFLALEALVSVKTPEQVFQLQQLQHEILCWRVTLF